MLVLSIIGIVSIATIAVVVVIEYRSADVIEQPIVEQPAIQTGQQATIECIGGEVHIDGVNRGKWVTINWAAPVINQPDMKKTLYCIWDTNVKVSGTIHVNPNDKIQIR